MLQKIPDETPKQLKILKMDFRLKLIKTNSYQMINILGLQNCVFLRFVRTVLFLP
jgi:hypothetical protein